MSNPLIDEQSNPESLKGLWSVPLLDITDDFASLPLIYADDTKLFEIVDEPAVSVGRLNSDLTLAEILDKMAAALAHFVHNGVQII